MKTAILSLVASMAFLLAPQTNLSAQKTATWKGGAPGQPTEWNCAKNWAENRVPNEFSAVVIPDCSTSTFSNPVLKSGEVVIWTLEIQSGASITIGKTARLIATEKPDNELTAWTEGTIRQGADPMTLVFASK